MGRINISLDGCDLKFEYTMEFKKSGLSTIPSFPDAEKAYSSHSVFNFLVNRIPPKLLKDKRGIDICRSKELMEVARKVAHSPIEMVPALEVP